jgi:hypothetical protein
MTAPINSAVDILVRGIWATLDRKEKEYLKDLEREAFAQIKTIFQFNQARGVVVFLKRELSPNAVYLLELQGFTIRLEKERSFKDGITTDIYRKALVIPTY